MPVWLTFIVLALAVYRVTRFWIKDDLIAGQRIWLQNVTLGTKPNVVREKLHELLGCHYCVSGQLSWMAVAIVAQFTSIPLPGLVWLGVWGIEPLLWRWSEDIIDIRVHIPGVVRTRDDKFGQS